jgi:hypothetical protein
MVKKGTIAIAKSQITYWKSLGFVDILKTQKDRGLNTPKNSRTLAGKISFFEKKVPVLRKSPSFEEKVPVLKKKFQF